MRKPWLFVLAMWGTGLPMSAPAAMQDWVGQILSLPNPDSCRSYLQTLTEEPHVAGTEEDFAVANFILSKLTSFGLDARIESYDVYLPYPKAVRVVQKTPAPFEGPTAEPGFAVDKDSWASNLMRGFNAYSPSGEAEAQVVYVNYGRPEDYRALAAAGISVRNRIVLARYGKGFRGVKARLAEEHGAAGLLLYSDPADDGYMQGDLFPAGPYRPEFAVQRGSIQYLFEYPGDPLTPGVAALPSAKRLAPEAAGNLPRVPTAPLSYGDARHILEQLAGPNVPAGWQGGLPFAYHLGPGPSEVILHVEMDYQIRPIWNVVATIPGAIFPDEVVVIGNHHDAWTYGAVDPNSGTSALLEIARTCARLLQQGWRPKRTIILAYWDGEEYGLLGSTEWVEQYRNSLLKKCVGYINLDAAVSGQNFTASATPSLKPLIQQVIAGVADPRQGVSVLERLWKRQNEAKKPRPSMPDPAAADSMIVEFGDLGSGSDYTAFCHCAGIPSMTLAFRGPYGVYHSAYDNFYWMSHFGDPPFVYHAAMARIGGLLLYRLATDNILPYAISQYAREISRQAQKMEKRWRDDQAPDDVTLRSIIDRAAKWQAEATWPPMTAAGGEALKPQRINQLLLGFDRIFLDEKGLPGRPWYKHLLYAPGSHTGYAAQVFPGINDQYERENWDATSAEISRVLEVIDRAVARTADLRAILPAASPNK